MALLLAIDPGVVTGWASFLSTTGELYQCGLGADWPKTFQYTAIIEYPQVYPHTSAKQANDLIKLAIMVGEYKVGLPGAELVLPHTWKGNTPKPVHHVRIWEDLAVRERARMASAGGVEDYIQKCYAYTRGERKTEPASKVHNLFDAVGLGMWKFGRKVQ